jgi:hypothetical protein
LIRGFDAKQECHIPWGGANCWTWLAAGTGKLKTLVHRLWDGRRNRGVNFAQSVCCWAPQVCLLLQSQFLRNGQHYTLYIFICFIHLYTKLQQTTNFEWEWTPTAAWTLQGFSGDESFNPDRFEFVLEHKQKLENGF